jgi:hypothetical protein
MNLKKKLLNLVVLLGLLFLPTHAVYAQGPNPGDVVLFGQNYTLKSGETLNGSLVLIGGNITIEKDAKVNGDVVLIGGNLDTAGPVSGDVVLIGGNANISNKVSGNVALIGGQAKLTDTAVITGDVTTVGSQLTRDPKAQINGEIVNNAPPTSSGTPTNPNIPKVDVSFNPLTQMFNVLFKALAMAGIAALLTLFLDVQIKRVGDYAVSQPVIAGSVGLLTLFVAALLFLTVLPIFIVVCAWLLGIVALGQEVGDRFNRAINQTWQPILSTAFGTFLLTLIAGYVGLIPCIGWLFNFILALAGIGAVIMTRFGTRSGPSAVSAVQGVPAG